MDLQLLFTWSQLLSKMRFYKEERGEVAAVLISTGLFLFLIVSMICIANARDLGQWENEPPEVRAWAQAQLIPGGPNVGQSCCTTADGVEVQEEIRGTTYWITFNAMGSRVGPMPVPSETVLKGPNKKGIPWVWWYSEHNTVKIRCFAPGGGV